MGKGRGEREEIGAQREGMGEWEMEKLAGMNIQGHLLCYNGVNVQSST